MKHILYFYLFGCILLISCKDQESEQKTATSEQQKPNIILIMADDQGWGDLSHSGNTNLSTPNIDALAYNGVSFNNFFVQPVCSPTRAELLTGRYFPLLGVRSTSAGGERMNLGETTLATILKEAGYATAAYGKWHNGMQPPYHPNARGFDDFYGFASGHWGNYFDPMLEHNGEIVKGAGFLTDDLTDHGMEFMTKNKEQPFFLFLPFNTPHSPMQVPDTFWNRIKDRDLEMNHQGDEEENIQFTKAALAMVENIDENVGRIMAHLDNLALTDNTIVIYLSDNGPNGIRFNGGLKGRKGSTDEGGIKTPFFIQWQNKIPKGKKVDQIASALDVLPTLTNLAGIPLKTQKPIHGKDLTPVLLQENPDWEERLIFNHWNGKTSVRSQKYRLDENNELFDMVADSGQTTPIARQVPSLTDSLKNTKDKWETEVLPTIADKRPFTLGHPDYTYTQLPARDGIPHGTIKRSNKYPNDSFFTHWNQVQDSITWDAEVLADGEFMVDLYYTCNEKNIGSTIELRFGGSSLKSKILVAHDPPLTGMENDRVERMESYVKDFRPMQLGKISLKKGRNTLSLKALDIPAAEVMDFRLLLFKRLD